MMTKRNTSAWRRVTSGFTLIEVMITVAIVGILAAIALPNYSQYVERGRRKDATAVLMEAAQFAERYFTENRTYVGVNAAMPAALKTSPREGSAWYNIASSGEAVSTYTLTAAPTSAWTPTKCGSMSVNQIGVRLVTTPASPSASDISDCFNR